VCGSIGVEVASYNHAVCGPDSGHGTKCILGQKKTSMWLDLFAMWESAEVKLTQEKSV